MPRKVVRVYLTPMQKKILEEICYSLGMAESDVLRIAFLNYAKDIGVIARKVSGKSST